MVFMLVRWTVPRFRYDQVMDLGWKLMLPAALVVLMVTAGTILGLDAAGVRPEQLYGGFLPVYALVLAVVNLAMLGVILWILDRGRVLSGGYADQERRAHARVVADFRREAWPGREPNPSARRERATSYGS